MLSGVSIRLSILRTASLAPPWSGPYSAATPAATAEYGSTWEDPTARTALVEQFCSWSAWRMNRTSSARSSRGSGSYLSSVILYIIERKLPGYVRSLSGYTYGWPMLWRYENAASVGILATS